jgi:L,D-transpeptidase catalytic domain
LCKIWYYEQNIKIIMNLSIYLAVITAIATFSYIAPNAIPSSTDALEAVKPILATPGSQTPLKADLTADLSDRQLCYLDRCFPITVGSAFTPTPIGTYRLFLADASAYGFTLPVLGFLKDTENNRVYAIHDDHGIPIESSQGCIVISQDAQRFLLNNYAQNKTITIQP